MRFFLYIFILAVGLLACQSGGDQTETFNSTGSPDGLPCDTMGLRVALQDDPLFQEAMDLENPFYTFMRETDSLAFDRINKTFMMIYEQEAVNMEPCSEAYLEAFGRDPEVQRFARILCEQMDLNQAIKDKYPCIMQLSEADREAVLNL